MTTTPFSHRVQDRLTPARVLPGRAAAAGFPDPPPDGVPTALAVDLGSGCAQIWTPGRGMVIAPTSSDGPAPTAALVNRGRVVNPAGCVALLNRLLRHYPQPLPTGPVVLACCPVLATPADTAILRQVLTTVFDPARLRFIPSVRAAAIGAGTAAGVLLVADVGSQLTEVAILSDGRVVAARRADTGTRDLTRHATPDMVAHTVARLVSELRRDHAGRDLAGHALRRGLLLVGDGAARPELPGRMTAALGAAVRPAATPHTAALRGAGIVALAACRNPTAAAV